MTSYGSSKIPINIVSACCADVENFFVDPPVKRGLTKDLPYDPGGVDGADTLSYFGLVKVEISFE